MKFNKLISILILVCLMAGFSGTAQVPTQAAEGKVLVAVPVKSHETLQLFQSTGLDAYGLLDGYILAGADSVGQSALMKAGLTYLILDSELSSGYYLATTMSPAVKLDWSRYGRVLLDLGKQAVLQSSPDQAERLSLAGAELSYINLDPIVLPVDQSQELVFPQVVVPDPVVQMVIDQVSQTTVSQYDRELAGELAVWVDGAWYTITTRQTYSGTPIQKATHYVGQRMAAQGLNVEYHVWNAATNPNVIGEITGQIDPQDIYIIGGHLDDVTGTPGADDNASGSVAAMIAAELLSQYDWSCTVRFAFWTGEEQGLLGSSAYAARSASLDENILGYLNLDMIAWNTPDSSPGIDLLYNPNMPPTLQLAQLMADTVDAYDLNLIPQLVTSLGGGSDHSSFWAQGYTSILAIEDQGDFNPYYHTAADTPAHTDLAYFTEFVKASIATFMHMSDCVITGGVGNLDGTVSAADDGQPIPFADLQIESSGGDITNLQADAAGYYTQTLLADTYTVTASAYAYLPQTISGIDILTGTLVTQNFSLDTAPEYVISGTVTELGSGLPLDAHITFDGSPLETWTDPVSGYYQIVIPQGAYTMNVLADLHLGQTRSIVVEADQTQDFELEPYACILLVDDDQNNPDMRSRYTDALNAISADYDVWDILANGDPEFSDLYGYRQIVWFQGSPSADTFTSDNEAVVADYLDEGGNFFLSGHEYLYDMGLTSFGTNYLHIGSYANDKAQTSVVGQNYFSGLGSYPLTYPFTNWSDVVHADGGSQLAFYGNKGDAAISYDGATFNTVFLAFPLEAVSITGRQAVLTRLIDFFGGCEPPEGLLEGHVTDANTEAALEGVSLSVDPTGDTTSTDSSGYYSLSLPVGEYQVTAELTGYLSQTLTTTVNSAATTTLDIALEPIILPPDIDVSPTSINTTLENGSVLVEPIVIANLGGSTLSYAISDPQAESWINFEPAAGNVEAGSNQVISVTLDATLLSSGIYTTTLEIASNDPDEPLASLPITLTVVEACIPVGGTDISWTPESAREGESVTFTASVTGSEPISFLWEFSDGITSTAKIFTRSFEAGVYTVTLTTSNACGEQTISDSITVVALPTWEIYLPIAIKH